MYNTYNVINGDRFSRKKSKQMRESKGRGRLESVCFKHCQERPTDKRASKQRPEDVGVQTRWPPGETVFPKT